MGSGSKQRPRLSRKDQLGRMSALEVGCGHLGNGFAVFWHEMSGLGQ
jgi:hypothetical protein